MNNKGQGALEMLLVLGGAVLIAAVVIAMLFSLSGESGNSDLKEICEDKFGPNLVKVSQSVGSNTYCKVSDEEADHYYYYRKYNDEWHPINEFIEVDNGYVHKSEVERVLTER